MEADAVGVLGQSLPDVKDDVPIDREGNGMRSTQPDLAVGPHPVQQPADRIRVDRLGMLTQEAKHHGLDGAVPSPGGAQ